MKIWIRIAPGVFAAALSPVLLAQPAWFTGVGVLPGTVTSRVTGLSADGMTVIGTSEDPLGPYVINPRAFRWTAGGGGLSGLFPAGTDATPTGISADGSVIVGSIGVLTFTAWRWTASTGPVQLPMPGGFDSSGAAAVSGDGQVVVGMATREHGPCPGSTWAVQYDAGAWRWSAATGVQKLQALSGYAKSKAIALSGSGVMALGASFNDSCQSTGVYTDCYWTGASGAIPGPFVASGAFTAGGLAALSFDGSIGVGSGMTSAEMRAIRWHATGLAENLGTLAGHDSSYAAAVSPDGATVVGAGFTGTFANGAAFVWDQAHGIRDIRATLADLGVDLTGWTLRDAAGVSADGRTVAGTGVNPAGHEEGWVAFLGDAVCYPDCTADGALTVADFGCFQTKFAAGDPYADCNADGQLAVADFGCFQTAFVLGCP